MKIIKPLFVSLSFAFSFACYAQTQKPNSIPNIIAKPDTYNNKRDSLKTKIENTYVKADSITNTITKTIAFDNKTDSLKTKAENIYIKVEGESKSWWTDWLPFLATLILAYAAYRGVIKQSKASSVSGFRVTWIEDLRVSYSKFLIALRNVDNKVRLGTLDPTRYREDKDLDDVQFLKTKIKLLLNHNATTDPEHVAFWSALLQYMEDHRAYYKGAFSEATENELDQKRVVMERLLLSIFKKEWDKAKNFG